MMFKNFKTLGRGTFGIVYKAENVTTSEEVAIKKYKDVSRTKDIHCTILREINIIRMLKHPNIIDLKEIRLFENSIEIIMSYGGESLRSYYGRISYAQCVAEVRSIAAQIIAGVSYMHDMHCIHRDLKPDNILITGSQFSTNAHSQFSTNPGMVVKICDFGLAKKLSPYNAANSYQVCTLMYRPPELFTVDNRNYDFTVDIWSLGCILYEFIIKEPVFRGSREVVMLKNILSTIPVIESDLIEIGLTDWKIESCNTDDYYKLKPLYDIGTADTSLTGVLDSLKDLVQQMLRLVPRSRIRLRDAMQHKLFTGIIPESTDRRIETYRISCQQDYYIRQKLPPDFNESLRLIYVDSLFDWLRSYTIDLQTIYMSIGLLDRFICSKYMRDNYLGKNRKPEMFPIVTLACLILASKYVDIVPLTVKNFRSNMKCPESQLVSMERTILNVINFDLNQPTLLDFYRAIGYHQQEIPESHLRTMRILIGNYGTLEGRGIPEVREILAVSIRK